MALWMLFEMKAVHRVSFLFVVMYDGYRNRDRLYHMLVPGPSLLNACFSKQSLVLLLSGLYLFFKLTIKCTL